MIGLDRDGTLLASRCFEDGHPKNINRKNILNKIDKNLINKINNKNYNFVVISNQDGSLKFKGKNNILNEMMILIKNIERLKAIIWSENNGKRAKLLLKNKNNIKQFSFNNDKPIFRKPEIGLLQILKEFKISIDFYIGDQSGFPNWANGKNSDKKFAQNGQIRYLDIKNFCPDSVTRSGQ